MVRCKLPKGIRQKPNGKYTVDVCVNGVRKTATCDSLDEALLIRQKLELEIKLATLGVKTEMRENQAVPTETAGETWTLKEACDYCRETKWKTLRNKKNMETKIKAMLRFFGENEPINKITTKRVDEFSSALIRKYKPGTVNLYLSGLSTVLNMAHDREMLDKVPKIPHIKDRAKRIKFLSIDEEKRILNLLDRHNPEMRDMVITLIDTGMRKGELLNLKADNIDLGKRLITIWKTKTDRPRTIPMTDRVYKIIEMRVSSGRKIDVKKYSQSRLFPINYSTFMYHWKHIRHVLGYDKDPDFVPHMLRHTCCSRLVQKGAELIKVSKWLGHNNITTTMRYAHLAPDALIDMKGLLEQ